MSLTLHELASCFEGVIPSVIATSSADGTPNISYLSHVVMADAQHIALSNQFFSKTAANVRANPCAAVLVVDPRDGRQYHLEVTYERSSTEGELFEAMATQLRASSAQVGMAAVMRLRCVDLYRVRSIHAVACVEPAAPARTDAHDLRLAIAALTRRIAEETDLGSLIDAVLNTLSDALRDSAIMLLLKDAATERLTTVGSRGYECSGIGSEVAIGTGLIGSAALERRPVRISDMSRTRRFAQAVQSSSSDERLTRTIVLPGMANAMSQLALPLIAHGMLRGILFLESTHRLAFSQDDETLLALLAAQLAGALALIEGEPAEAQPVNPPAEITVVSSERSFRVVHHTYDDSVFIDHEYLIKGVPGRVLMHLLRCALEEERTDFTNREIRLSEALRLPDVKDNLETRLLLLRRRLEDKAAPVRLIRTGRGRIRLQLAGLPILETVAG